MRPVVLRHVSERYGNKQSGSVCPGEMACERFGSAKGDTQELKIKNACLPCELFSTKLSADEPFYLDNLLSRALKARRMRDSGFGIEKAAITSAEFETILMIDDATDQFELFERQKTSELLMMFMGGGK